MTITTRTIYPNLLYQLQISDTAADVEVIRYTYATGLLSSAYLPASALTILQRRWDLLVQDMSASLVNTFSFLLPQILFTGSATPDISLHYGADGDGNFLYFTGLDANFGFVIHLGVPHSADMWLVPSIATGPL